MVKPNKTFAELRADRRARDEVVCGQPPFITQDSFTIYSRGDVHIVEIDRECPNFDWLINHKVEIDGVTYQCKGVEWRGPGPYSPGTKIGILVAGEAPL